jgi:hypothetical protein
MYRVVLRGGSAAAVGAIPTVRSKATMTNATRCLMCHLLGDPLRGGRPSLISASFVVARVSIVRAPLADRATVRAER